MTTQTLTPLQDIYDLIDQAATCIDWSPKYVNLLSTTATSMFVSHGNPSGLVISPDNRVDQINTLTKYLEDNGRSIKTAGTYSSAWGRIISIVNSLDSSTNQQDFWNDFSDKFKDQRLARRRVKKISTSMLPVAVPTNASSSSVYQVTTASGYTAVILPEGLTSVEALELIQVINNHVLND
jgi:hypothetical protein